MAHPSSRFEVSRPWLHRDRIRVRGEVPGVGQVMVEFKPSTKGGIAIYRATGFPAFLSAFELPEGELTRCGQGPTIQYRHGKLLINGSLAVQMVRSHELGVG